MKRQVRHALAACATILIALLPAARAQGAAPANAAPKRTATLHLRDNTQLVGVIRELTNGVYVIETSALGLVRVPAESVSQIRFGASGDPAPAAGPARGRQVPAQPRPSRQERPANTAGTSGGDVASLFDVESFTRTMLGNPEIMRMIGRLQEDPQVQAVLQDPTVVKAVESGNLLQLLTNPKVRGLLENKSVQEISRSVLGEE